jgi:hypothetical protein
VQKHFLPIALVVGEDVEKDVCERGDEDGEGVGFGWMVAGLDFLFHYWVRLRDYLLG